MPATSERQRKFMGAELARKRAGKKTRTGMSESQLRDYSTKPRKGGAHGVVKRTQYGSAPFSQSEIRRGFKVVS